MNRIFSLLVALWICPGLYADVRLPRLFGDNMVLQRNRLIPVWGWADPGERVCVQFHHQTKKAKADKQGRWVVKLDDEPAGGPYELQVRGKNEVSFKNVLVGEVWICSGQSNMAFTVQEAMNAGVETANANYPEIRHITIPHTISSFPREDIPPCDWKICNPSTAGNFSAAGYFFARELYNRLKVPVGLINASWGATVVETWTSRKAFEESDEFKNMIKTVPFLDLDSLAKTKTAQMLERVKSLQGDLNPDHPETWKNPVPDHQDWPKMQLPAFWGSRQLGEVDAIVWFRKELNISSGDTGKPGVLELGKIDNNDTTYINGVKIGSARGYNEERIYTIPAGLLKEGINVLAVRVDGADGNGGIYGDSSALKLTIGSKIIGLSGTWFFKVEKIKAYPSVSPNSYPSLLFNAMINPLIPYAMEGVIWYQGESNAGRAYQYRKSFPLMIRDWRAWWKEGDFPFYFVQIASFNAGNGNSRNGSTWAELREAQTMALSLPNTGMVVTTDVGNPSVIHPVNKQAVGRRLAAIALNKVYGQGNVYEGPTYQSLEIKGGQAVVHFTGVGSGLLVKNKYGYINGFEVAGTDRQFHFAKAYLAGNSVVLSADSVPRPMAVRYGWADDAGEDNLFNKEGFPAAPFRTDQWRGITENIRYEVTK